MWHSQNKTCTVHVKVIEKSRRKKHHIQTLSSQFTSAVALTQVREPPDIAKSHAEPHAGEQILSFVVPLGSVSSLLLLHLLQFPMRGDPVIQSWVRNLKPKPHVGVGVDTDSQNAAGWSSLSSTSLRRICYWFSEECFCGVSFTLTACPPRWKHLLWLMAPKPQLSVSHQSMFCIMWCQQVSPEKGATSLIMFKSSHGVSSPKHFPDRLIGDVRGLAQCEHGKKTIYVCRGKDFLASQKHSQITLLSPLNQ